MSLSGNVGQAAMASSQCMRGNWSMLRNEGEVSGVWDPATG